MWLAAFSSSSVSKNTVLQRADPARAVDERELAEPRRAVVLRARGAQRLGVLVGVDLDGAAALELDAQPLDDRAVELERQRRADVAVDPQRVGRRERLLARDVRVVREAVDGRELGGMPDRRPEEADRQVGARPVEVDRVEPRARSARSRSASASPSAPSRRRRDRPRRAGTRARSPPRAGRAPRPARRRGRRSRPTPASAQGATHQFVVRAVDDRRPMLGQIGKQIDARALGRHAVERVRRLRPAERDPGRVLVREVLHPVGHPGRDVGERLRVAVQQPLALDPLVGVPDVDELGAALVGGSRDLAGQLFLADVARDAERADPAERWPRTRRSGRRAGGSGRSSRAPRGRVLAHNGRVRLNRYLARAGVASRRAADELIKAGRVTVNGAARRAEHVRRLTRRRRGRRRPGRQAGARARPAQQAARRRHDGERPGGPPDGRRSRRPRCARRAGRAGSTSTRAASCCSRTTVISPTGWRIRATASRRPTSPTSRAT